jgi:hypothetical protein
VTLVLGITTLESIWLLTDRRLSSRGRKPVDDGQKSVRLETTDGVALMGYAGLGATAYGTQPAHWMTRVLRGRNLPLERSLGVLADAMQARLPKHMTGIPVAAPTHDVMIASFVGGEPRLYTINVALSPDRKAVGFNFTRWLIDRPPRPKMPPWLALAGSGSAELLKDATWKRELLRIVRAHDLGKVSRQAVADKLANTNLAVSHADINVGPRCVVLWQSRKGGFHKMGGDCWFYTGGKRDSNSPFVPTISWGADISALGAAVLPHMMKEITAQLSRQPLSEASKAEGEAAMQAALRALPDTPDETLR